MNRSSFSIVHAFLLIALLQLTLFCGFAWFSYSAISSHSSVVVLYERAAPTRLMSNSTVYGYSVFRVIAERNKAVCVDSVVFEGDVFLIGAAASACGSKPEAFNFLVSSMVIDDSAVENFEATDEYGNGWFDWRGQIYFFIRINATVGVLADTEFLPSGYGFYVPHGQPVYLTMHNTWDVGVGGTVSIYYVKGLDSP